MQTVNLKSFTYGCHYVLHEAHKHYKHVPSWWLYCVGEEQYLLGPKAPSLKMLLVSFFLLLVRGPV